MAEEFDNTQKPKVELIKHTKTTADGADHSGTDKSEERRKVVVVKKKAPSQGVAPQGTSSQAPVKKAQPKVVAVSTQPVEQPQVKSEAKSPSELVEKKPVGNEVSNAQKTPELKPSDTNKVSAMPNTQRPAAAAGRVGGRPVGPRHDGPRPDGQNRGTGQGFQQRPQGAAGYVGGRPVGPRPQGNSDGGGYNNRNQGGGGRPGFGGQGRPYNGQGGQGQGFRPNGPGQGGQGRPGGYAGGNNGGRPGFGGGRPGGPGQGRPGGGGRPGMPPAGPPPVEGKNFANKKSFKAKKPVYQRREEEMEEKLLSQKKKSTHIANPIPKQIDILGVISVSELARKMNLKASELIAKLMSMGMMVTINQQIDAETASILCSEYGTEVKVVDLYDETVIEMEVDEEGSKTPRPPVVTVMGHVDHGKTKLLDAIRKSDTAAGEFGGITQHIGAYSVETPKGRITFLDTPGHEAFTRMRARGAQVTDIVVLVVAADDGVMPQTVEAINHAKEAGVPIIVAVNKIDKPEANPDKVKSQLSELGLMPSEWGGQTTFVEISALKKEGIDKLVEEILLEAEMGELKANYNRAAEGKIMESRIDHGRGIVATVIIEAGTLCVGDSFVAGIWPGKVRALFNDRGVRVDEATPAMPVEVLGFEGIPNAGDPIQVVDDERTARGISSKRQELKRFEDSKNVKKITLDNLYDTINDGEIQELKVIIKADVQGSAEALKSSLEKLSTKEIRLTAIQALPGAINEGDVDLAIASNAILIGFNVRPTPKAKALADSEKVDIRKYNVIYKAVEEMQQAMEGMLTPDTKEEVIGTVEVRDTFKVPKIGTIAGCYVLTGTVKRSASVNLIRDGIVIHTGKIASLRRFKDDAREVAAGYECGIGLDGFDNVQVDDQFEVFEIVEVARKLK
ncbi:MAG: translation initiation factor IF-2 [Treponema sp.]|jgi:translation initiation factor IF-2|nr:translation initiation factor IF-2 [Treponema sp.]